MFKDMLDHARDDTPQIFVVNHSRHRVRLARAGLTIGKHCAVVAIQDALYDLFGRLFKDVHLLRVHVEYSVVVVLDFAEAAVSSDALNS